MPWKKPLFGKVKVSGVLKDWMDIFQEWYKSDVPKKEVTFEQYVNNLGIYYLMYALERWKDEKSREDIKELAVIKFVAMQGNPLAIYDALDHISTRMNLLEMQDVGNDARNFARKQIHQQNSK